jgi:sugar lactone lactonase YvrE
VEPVGLEVVGDNLYVADVGNGRIQVFGPDYRFRSFFEVLGWEDQVWTEPYIAVDSKNNLWVTDSGASRIERFSSAGTLTGIFGPSSNPLGEIKNAKGIAWANGNLILSDFGNQRIVICPAPE